MNTRRKNWSELKADSSWRMFKIMSEFVDGFEKMEKFGPCISIFGSARTKPGTRYYQMAVETARLLAREGFGIITGGGPGIMEAGNKGAKEGKGISVGLHIELEFEQDWNDYIDTDKLLIFKYFFARKVMFIRYAQAFVFMPGGFGTMDEVFETLTLVQTKKVDPVPLIFMGSDYWSGLFEWIEKVMLHRERNINPEDLKLYHVTDDPRQVVKIINTFYKRKLLKPNYRL
ncbi:MAG: TIGR00730 family Rossman fold protein [Chitinophagales bacterium]|nr:TIGR00730 family Rossman fold protein [Chitinophagales bacterium]MDW8418806.1 TIGR00730 family Rossman fold protein [Chitinophagales bacterium]